MAYYYQVTETLWITEPKNYKERIYILYLWCRGKVGRWVVEDETGERRKVWLMTPKDAEQFMGTLELRKEI